MTVPTCENITLIGRRSLKNDYHWLRLGPYSRAAECQPGQFVHMQLPSTSVLFRRAFSVAGVNQSQDELEIIFRRVGRGTTLMSKLRRGDTVNLLGPLGSTFRQPRKNRHVVIVAGGIGFPPLMFFATRLIAGGHNPRQIEFLYGGRVSADILMRSRIKQLGVNFHPVTEDGSFGEQGLVTGPLQQLFEKLGSSGVTLYSCGPGAMLKAVNSMAIEHGVDGQLSLEAPMPCGLGMCQGCVVPLTAGGHARVCCDGPVFDIGEVAL